MTNRGIYRKMIFATLAVGIAGLLFCCWLALKSRIPGQLYVSVDGEIPDLFGDPLGWIVAERVDGENAGAGAPEAAEPDAGRSGDGAPEAAEPDAGRSGDGKAGAGNLQELEAASMQACGDGAGPGALEESPLAHVARTYDVEYSLFGRIPLATASVNVVARTSVYAGGIPIGIYMETDGVMVVDTDRVTAVDGEQYTPAANILKAGDYIKAADGEPLENKEELIECFNNCGGGDVVLDVTRNGEDIRLKVTPVQTGEHAYKAGIWVRNDTQGIGTLTYVEDSGQFGALGHGISDIDTGKLLRIRDGVLYDSEVVSIVKGMQGVPGELAGIIHYSDGYAIGAIEENQENGIYGEIYGFPYRAERMRKYEIAYKHEVSAGPATILCSVDGECREYGIEIEELRMNGKDVNKGMVLRVTDDALLELTGGIVQGMSGSPILQDGRIVGAVTHVFVNDPTKGYGIFIENMLGH